MSDQRSLYFELESGSVNSETGEKSFAGVKVSVPLTIAELAVLVKLPYQRLSIITEERYNAEYADDEESEDWAE